MLRKFLALFLALSFFTFSGSALNAAEKLSPDQVAALLPQLFKLHYSQHEMDAGFVKRLLKILVEQLDATHSFFIKEEVDAIVNLPEKDLKALAEKSLGGDFTHYRTVVKNFLETQIARDDALYTALEKKADEIKQKGNAEDKGDDKEIEQIKWSERPATNIEREKRIYKATIELFRVNKAYLNEAEALKMALLTMREERDKWAKISLDEEVPKLFLKSFMLALDPHTEYFDADDEEEFNVRLERSFAGIGVQIRPCPLGAQVEDIIKGGPSEKSGKFTRGDQIVAVDSFTLAGLPINKIVKRIKGEKGTEVKLTVLKHDTKKTEVVSLTRDTIELADMRVKGKKFESPQGTIGLISVQAFYSGVHNDVRERIKELSKDKPLAGVVLDLRYNAGGYLEEAVGLAGLFIDSGPIVGERDGAGRIHWNEDPEHDVAFTGPLTVLVNQFSASASEIVAGALKDYGRAVIVAPTATFGKGTVQRVIPLSALNLPGDIKITTHMYFLAGGDSVQLKGVEPDVTIPGAKLLEDEGMLERTNENAIPWRNIKGKLDKSKAEIKMWNEWKVKNVPTLQEKSVKRVAENGDFKAITDPKSKKDKQPDEPPPDKENIKDPQADEAVNITRDMIAGWPAIEKQAAK
jgi:carboxyl-terminal processing protease